MSQEDMLYADIPFQRGMSFTTWGAYSFNSTEAEEEILEMKEIGIEWVGVNIWWTQESITSTEIFPGDWTDTPANITDFFKFIHEQGMKVLFKPMLDSQDEIWRSYIEASPDWIKEYARFIRYTAEIAENGSVEVFSIGCEMGNWQVHEDDVVSLIDDLREQDIYSGMLTYSANHDSFWYINFWDKLDIIGVDAYFAFTLSYNPSLQDMIEVWNGFYDDLHKFQKKWKKPILFTELGCQNRDGCNIAPNDNKFNLNQDEKEFQMFYESLFQSKIWKAPWFKGTYWWMWDCRVINELEDNGFTPQLPIIKSTIHKYYTQERELVYPNYWLEFIMILLLGGLITFISAYLIRKFYKLKENNSDELNNKSDENQEKKEHLITKFVLINGILFGAFIFWAFNYYNQTLFNILYSSVTKSFFLGESVVFILLTIVLSIVFMIFTWIFLQRLVYKRIKDRTILISTIILVCSVFILIIESFYSNTLSNEITLNFFLNLQVMIILGIIFSMTYLYGFPRHIFETLEKKEKLELLMKIVFGILAITSIMLIGLSYLLHEYLRAPSILIGITLLILVPLVFNYLEKIKLIKTNVVEFERISLKEKLRPNQMKFIEALLCLFAMVYYLGILRYYDVHVLINFNLRLLPNFFVPIGYSLLIAIPMILGFYVIINSKYASLSNKIDLENHSKNDILVFFFKMAIYFSLIMLIACWLFSDIAFELVLVLGGIPLIMIFMIYLIGNIDSTEIFKEKGSWKRLTLYLVIFLTIAFSANGITVGLLYILTFLTLQDGQIVVRTAFGEELGFDAIQLIYNIQLIVAVIPILISLVLLIIVVPKIRE